MKIAISGKGGVGKTLIAGGLARGFSERGLKTIAIDADSSPNLALTLGLSGEILTGAGPVGKGVFTVGYTSRAPRQQRTKGDMS